MKTSKDQSKLGTLSKRAKLLIELREKSREGMAGRLPALLLGASMLGVCGLVPWVAKADVSILVTPQAAGFEAGLAQIRANPLVLESTDVFAASERAALQSLGDSLSAGTIKLRVKYENAFRRIEAWGKKNFPKLKIEKNPEAKLQGATPYRMQWGLNNVGDSQRLDMDDISSIQIAAKRGEDIGLTRATDERVGPAAVRVAILDSGIDLKHPSLKGQIITKPNECAALAVFQKCVKDAGTDVNALKACDAGPGKVDTDGNGYPLDCSGWSVSKFKPGQPADSVLGEPDAQDSLGHGTHVAGIIGAAANDVGIRGVLGRVNLIPIRVIDRNPNNPIRPQVFGDEVPGPTEGELRASTAFGDLLARGILYAIRSKAQVINLSLAWPLTADSLLMRKMVALAQSQKILVVASAGNDSTDAQVFPCAYPGVICVAAHGPDGALSHFSNYGPFVDVAAPGLRILSTWPMDKRGQVYTERPGYELKNGTSMAAPLVAGVLAHLLNDGYSPEEATARLLLSTRPVASTSLRNPVLAKKDLRFGNVDLAAALQVQPQPLILPSEKRLVRLAWDARTLQLPFDVKLKNFYKDGASIEVRAAVVDSAPGAKEATLTQDRFTFPAWKAGEEKTLSLPIKLRSDRVEGRLSIEFTVLSGARELNRFRVPVEINVNVDKLVGTDGASYPIEGTILRGASLRSITAQAPGAPNEYLATVRGAQGWQLQLVKEAGNRYQASPAVETAAIAGEIFLVSQLPSLGAQEPAQYVLIARVAAAQGQTSQRFLFRFLDSQLRTRDEFIYDNNPAVLTERFQWMKLDGQWVPAWVALGKTPASELPDDATDPWDLNPVDVSEYRFYYLTRDGKPHTVKAPKDHVYIETLSASENQRGLGVVPVVLGKGTGFEQTYARAAIQEAKLVNQNTLQFTRSRQLQTAPILQEVFSLKRGADILGTAFSGTSTKGAMRTTLIPTEGTQVTFDSSVSPLNTTESVMRISGVYQGARTAGAFAQTHYELQYHDLGSGDVRATSLNRFSFLPSFIQQKSFFPMLAQDERQPTGERLPAILIPSGLGDSLATEIILPVYENGRLVGISRPAKLKLEDSASCSSLGRPRPATANEEAQILFFCGDRFVRVPVRY